MDVIPTPTTLLEAVRAFANPQVAHDYFVAIRWPNGMACPRMGCGSADVIRIANRNLWKCHECKKQFTAKVNTVFEDSPIGFDKWLPALWLILTMVFMLIHIVPGDPVLQMLGQDARAEDLAQLRHSLGLDQSIGVQYAHYLEGLAKGDWGRSIRFSGSPETRSARLARHKA